MERDAAISHGASSFLNERLMLVSDGYQMAFCKTCGAFAVNYSTKGYRPCIQCGDTQNFGRATIPYAYKLLVHLLAAPGINLRLEFVSADEYAYQLLNQTTQIKEGDISSIKTQLEEADQALEEEQLEQGDEGLDTDYTDVF